MKIAKYLIAIGLVLILGNFGIDQFNKVVSWSNTEISYTTEFSKQKSERISFYDKMYKEISQNSQIAVKNDSSFANIVNIVMDGQPRSLNAMFGALRLIDPSANYEQVSQFYTNLTNLVNSNREGFFQQEKVLQTINQNHENLIKQWPGSLYNYYFQRQSFVYTPIMSTYSKNVDKTGVDDNLKVF